MAWRKHRNQYQRISNGGIAISGISKSRGNDIIWARTSSGNNRHGIESMKK